MGWRRGEVGRQCGGLGEMEHKSEDWARWVLAMREREKKMRKKKEERREAGEREKKKEKIKFFLMREERESLIKYIYIFFFKL